MALLIGMKFTAYSLDKQKKEVAESVEQKIVEQNTMISQQTLKILMPVAKSVTKINEQLGL